MFTTFSLAVILDCTVRIVLGTALGALIGLERQLRARSAGIRTNALVALGSTLFVLVSELAVAGGSSGDPTRVAAQVASGIGFLGAGVILKHGASVSGLNTAATLWASAAVGTLTGSGDLVIAIIGAVMETMSSGRSVAAIERTEKPGRCSASNTRARIFTSCCCKQRTSNVYSWPTVS